MKKENLDNNLRKLRKSKKITQQDLGDAVGVTRQTIIAIEKGNYVPSVLLALKLGKYFKLPVNKIFSVKIKI